MSETKIVPVEPTMEMKRAASSMFYDDTFRGTTGPERAALVYKAMLSALLEGTDKDARSTTDVSTTRGAETK